MNTHLIPYIGVKTLIFHGFTTKHSSHDPYFLLILSYNVENILYYMIKEYILIKIKIECSEALNAES